MSEKIKDVAEVVVTDVSKEVVIAPKEVKMYWKGEAKIIKNAELAIDPSAFSSIYTSDGDVHLIAREPERCSCEITDEGRLGRTVECGWEIAAEQMKRIELMRSDFTLGQIAAELGLSEELVRRALQ